MRGADPDFWWNQLTHDQRANVMNRHVSMHEAPDEEFMKIMNGDEIGEAPQSPRRRARNVPPIWEKLRGTLAFEPHFSVVQPFSPA